jgi:hypothetical protein
MFVESNLLIETSAGGWTNDVMCRALARAEGSTPRTVRQVDSIRTPDSLQLADVKPASHRVAD